MKKMISVLVILAAMVCGMCIGSSANASEGRNFNENHIYSLTTVVECVDYDHNRVYCKDFNGEVWCFNGCEDWIEGDIASMVMFDNGSKIIYDDEIISVKYCGWFEGWEQ